MEKSDSEASKIKRPPLFWLITETGRAIFELGAFVPYKALSTIKKSGDGHPVFLLPGFMAGDISMRPLKNYLIGLGYSPHGWGLGRNLARKSFIDPLVAKLESIYESEGARVSLIGQSLGGVYARQIAKLRPDLVRQIITLGSPFSGIEEPNHARWAYDILVKGKPHHKVDPQLVENIPLPAPVPTTAIYSKEDGIVPWEACIEHEDDIHQNVQVRGSHIGMAVNPAVLRIVADRLQYDQDNWVPFRTHNMMEDLFLYPSV